MKLLNFRIRKNDSQMIIGSLAIMLAAFFWSLDGVFIRPKFYELPASLVVFLEHFLGFLVLSPFIFLNWQKIKKLSRLSWGAVLWVCLFGGLIGTLMITKAFFAAIDGEITFATVVILQKLQPVFALLLARIILGEKLSRQFYVWAIIAIGAAYFLAFGKSGLNFAEIDWFHSAAFFSFLAAFAFGSSTVFGKRIVNHLDFKTTAALRFGITSVLAFVLILINQDLFKIGQVGALQWKFLGVIVFTSGAMAMFIYYFGLKRVSASIATICELFWPLSAVVLDYFLNKNVLSTSQIIAAIVLLVAFYQVVMKGKPKSLIFSATVIAGEGRGAALGFPTANLDKTDLDIPHGVYLAEAEVEGRQYQGLLHFGYKETFNNEVSAEILIKDFSADIYKKKMTVKVLRKIREVIKFKNIDDLKKQIAKDLEVTE